MCVCVRACKPVDELDDEPMSGRWPSVRCSRYDDNMGYMAHLGFCANLAGNGALHVGQVFLPCWCHLLKQPRQKLC